MLSRRKTSRRSAFTLVESLIASAIVALTATSVYYAFLRMNDFAVASRCDTAAKVVLERAVNLAMTSEWRTSPPPILTTTDDFKAFDPDTGVDSPTARVSLFTDPTNQEVITGILSRKVVSYPTPLDKPLGDLVRITFKLEYRFHKHATDPVTAAYAYTVRASDK